MLESDREVKPVQNANTTRDTRLWIVFVPYAIMSVVHVASKYLNTDIEYPTKLMLMPLLALAIVVATVRRPGVRWATVLLLLFGVFTSWLGDGAAFFFPWFDDELPMMLLNFGLAHLAYMWLFSRSPGVPTRRVPVWAFVIYGLAYVVLMIVLVPHTGSLMIPVILYGLVLAGTATLSTRVNAITAWGGFWFLVSDTILAFRIFIPDALPDWSGPAVMVTYTLGQGLIGYGLMRQLRANAPS